MRKTLVAVSAIAALGLMGCQQDNAASDEATTQAASAVNVETMTDAQKQAYAMGASMAIFVQSRTEQVTELGGELDQELVTLGFTETLAEVSPLTMEQVQQFAQAGEQNMRQLQAQQAQKAAADNIEAGKAFLAENAKKEGVVTTESGLQYEVVTAGEGASPVATDTVKVHYHGELLDGTKFDSSYDRGEPATFPLNGVIAGWTEGVQLMKEGAKYRFYIPSELAYGQRSTGAITPHSTLVFDVELLEVVKPEAAEPTE